MIRDAHAVVALAHLVDDLVLKSGRTFALFDRFGDANHGLAAEQGVYVGGTRFLSRWALLVDEGRPEFLGSSVFEGDRGLEVDLTNHDISTLEAPEEVARGSVHVRRAITLSEGAAVELLTARNFARVPARLELELRFGADFADVFEVRGERRPARGRLRDPVVEDGCVRLAYDGLDGARRETVLCFSPPPDRLTAETAAYALALGPRLVREIAIEMTFLASGGERAAPMPRRDERVATAAARIETSSELASRWLHRARSDVSMLTTDLEEGPYPFAGIPWYCTVFGRDGIVTALQTLWWNPALARGVLRHLAATQATAVDRVRDAEPGKILHESRDGEMAALNEIPFGRYYGTVDATPLFVLLAGRYFRRTGDVGTLRQLWPAVERAMGWIASFSDATGGQRFVTYARSSHDGLENQGWKDSSDSIMHADGAPARGPIALCEVQGYAYAACRRAADLAEALGHPGPATDWRDRAATLQRRFHDAFWIDEIGCYALALDGDGRPCAVRSSNPGHCLYAGIVPDDHALRLADTLVCDDMFGGWGIRTLSTREVGHNPMSYHNGSVWPHDNALIAAGLSRYGLTEHACRITRALLDASLHFAGQRLPELFCGFSRHHGKGPVPYPVACSPQAWAAGTPLMLVQAMLGLDIDAPQRRVRLIHPALPAGIDWIRLSDLRIGASTIDLRVARTAAGLTAGIERREGPCELVLVSAPL